MTAAARGWAAGSPSDKPRRCNKPPRSYPQGTRQPRDHHDPIAADKIVLFALAVSPARLPALAASYAERRL